MIARIRLSWYELCTTNCTWIWQCLFNRVFEWKCAGCIKTENASVQLQGGSIQKGMTGWGGRHRQNDHIFALILITVVEMRAIRWSVNKMMGHVSGAGSEEWRLDVRAGSSVSRIWQVEQRRFLCPEPSNGNLKWGTEWHWDTLRQRGWGGGGVHSCLTSSLSSWAPAAFCR